MNARNPALRDPAIRHDPLRPARRRRRSHRPGLRHRGPESRPQRRPGRQGMPVQLALPLPRAHDLLHHLRARSRSAAFPFPAPTPNPPATRRSSTTAWWPPTTNSTCASTIASSASPAPTALSPSIPTTASAAPAPSRPASSSSPPATTTCPTGWTFPAKTLSKVHHYYVDPHPYFEMDVAVIGGKNSAAIAALELWRSGARVTLIHRGPADSAARQVLDQAGHRKPHQRRRNQGLLRLQGVEITPDAVIARDPRGPPDPPQRLRLRHDRLPPRLRLSLRAGRPF